MNDDFGDLQREFQAIDAPDADLVRMVEKGRRKLRRGLLVVAAIGAVTSSAGILAVFLMHDAASVVFAALEIGVPIAVLVFVAYSQRHAWQARSETTRGFLELEIERRRDEIRRMRFLRWILLPMTAMVVAFQALLIRKDPGMLSWHLAAVVGLGGPYAIAAWLLWVSLRGQKRFEREEADLMRKLADLDAEG